MCSKPLTREHSPAPHASTGLLLVGHGTRDRVGYEEFFRLSDLVARQSDVPLQPCFLELAEPNIAESVDEMAHAGVELLLVVPLMLFAAAHVQRDIPEAVEAAARGRMKVLMAPPLACHEKLLELSALRFQAALEAKQLAASDTIAVLVGRGSRDSEATLEMERFSQQRHKISPARETVHGFIAMASPPIEQVLDEIAARTDTSVVVQPHLLFHGELLSQINDLVATFQRSDTSRHWIVANQLGPHPLLAAAVGDRIDPLLSYGSSP